MQEAALAQVGGKQVRSEVQKSEGGVDITTVDDAVQRGQPRWPAAHFELGPGSDKEARHIEIAGENGCQQRAALLEGDGCHC
ncbi:hypothetical protein MCOR25_005761 [Pyricularia grisea]|nr:hypothetical protein MCOR25_005761 [Pyricularia grisea]